MNRAIEVLKQGGIILYPSDTIWGIGCDATNEGACQRILDLKKRPEAKSFIVLVDSWSMLERYVPEFNPVCYDIADLSEKPLTIIYPAAKGLADSASAEDGSVGIRITKDPLCLKLIQSIRRPLVSTSANLSGEPSPRNFSEIPEQIKKGVDYTILERTNESMSKASQIIKIALNGEVQIIRR